MGSNNHINIDHETMSEWWESKYKICRAAFLGMSQINRREQRNDLKLLQRLQQLAYDGQKLGGPYASAAKDAQFERIRQIILEHITEKVA